MNVSLQLAVAIGIAGVLIAAAILLSNRYAIERANVDSAWLIDQLTGDIRFCGVSATRGMGCVRFPSDRVEPVGTSR
jgi:hypothetical protein